MSDISPARDLVITGARVYTADPFHPWCEAVALRDGRILVAGDEADVLHRAGPRAERVHIPGGLLTPGLNDSHIHLAWGAANLGLLDLDGAETVVEVQARLRAYAAAHPAAPWIRGYGLAYEWLLDLHIPECEALDAAVPDRPVFLYAMDMHSAWVNTAALHRAGLVRGAALPPPNEVVVDPATGTATGMLKERLAIECVTTLLGEPTAQEQDDILARAVNYVNSLGITSVQNMNGALDDLARYDRLRERGQLSLHAGHYLTVREDTPPDHVQELAHLRDRYRSRWNAARGIKMFIDGVVESKTALMLQPYADGSRDRGVPDMDPDAYRAFVMQAAALGMDVATHAIGDAGVRLALDAYEAAREVYPGARHRIEHIEVVDPADLGRFAPLGVVASMQPLHAVPTGDPRATPWTRLVGPRREPFAFAWRALQASGARLVFGSDWPIVTPDARIGIFSALARQNAAGIPAGGWQPHQAVTLAQALDAYTRDAAFVERWEDDKGMVREGMVADVTVFAHDLFRLRAAEIRGVPIALTVVEGRVVYRADA